MVLQNKINKKLVIDLCIILIFIPFLLLTLFLLPTNIKNKLILDLQNPTALSILSSNFVHVTTSHLQTNLSWYFLTVILIYLSLNNRKKFYALLFFSFLIAPFLFFFILVVARTIGIYPKTLIYNSGFSGINSLLIGFLYWPALKVIQKDLKFNLKSASLFLLISAAGILLARLGSFTSPSCYLFYLCLLFASAFLFLTTKSIISENKKKSFKLTFYMLLAFLCLLVYFVGVYALIPQKIVTNHTATNIVVHYFGFIIGFIFPYFLKGKFCSFFSRKDKGETRVIERK